MQFTGKEDQNASQERMLGEKRLTQNTVWQQQRNTQISVATRHKRNISCKNVFEGKTFLNFINILRRNIFLSCPDLIKYFIKMYLMFVPVVT